MVTYRVQIGYAVDDQTPPVVATPEGWEDVFATRDIDGEITDYYEALTGHNPLLSYETLDGTQTVNETWLSTREGNGRVYFADGRWYVERYRLTGTLRVAADNITFTNMHLDSVGALYAIQSRAADGNAHGIIIQNSTIAGNGANDNGASLNWPEARDENQLIIRFCDFSGYRAGIYCFGGITAEYNYVHDLHYSEGSHNTGASVRAGNVTLRRNLIVDGNSAAISLYPEYGPYTNVNIVENVLRMRDDDIGPELLLASGRDFTEVSPGDTRVVANNLFYRGGNRGEQGGIGGYTAGLTQVIGNIDRLGVPVGDWFGVAGVRPLITEAPSAETTGAQLPMLQTMTGPEAMLAIKAATPDSNGVKRLKQTRITTSLNLNTTGADHLVFENCEIVVDSIYAIQAFYQAGQTEPTHWPRFEYCTISGGTSSSLRGGWVRLLRCDISRGTDLLKPFQAMEVWGCYLHDLYRSPGGHCDIVQIVSGCDDLLVHYNYMYGFTAADSPEGPSSWISGCLQIGTITGPIGSTEPARFTGNWVNGGTIGMRGSGGPSDNPNNHDVTVIWRDNLFYDGSFQFGAVGNMGVQDDFDSSNRWLIAGTPVVT